MRFIIHRNLNTKSSGDSYNLGKIMLYALGEKIHLSGISEYNYFMLEAHDKEDNVLFMLSYLINSVDEEAKQQYRDAMKSIKGYQQIKNKDSKVIIQYNLLKKAIHNHFEVAINEYYQYLNKSFDLEHFKDLIEYEQVNFYHLKDLDSIYNNPKVTPLTAVLSLQLPEEEGEFPILFLTNEDIDSQPNLKLKTFSPKSKAAETLINSYVTDVFQFPSVVRVPATMMKSLASEFSKKTKDIKEKLNQWAKLCFDNPNTNEGLTFFRAQVLPLIEEYKKTALDTQVGKELIKVNLPGNFGFLQFGEMPVEKIWELMLANDNCTEEEYQELLKLKETQAPKYDGRWPVVFFREEGIKEIKREEELAKMPSTRKTLDID
ncbi:hypothetical protein [Flavobacterium sp. N1994]|uniref:hypothetical protein n=1 Tax=Flavobacterium sp. N1994 TaxID=2986827 RepID=UPI002223D1C9|nr:hypothetical protein [Flavobacterium sp. N1994]